MSEQLHFHSTSNIDSLPLQQGQVHLWLVSLSIDEQKQVEFESVLNERQQQKMQRLKGDDRKRFYIAGRGYLNQLLQHYTGKKNSQSAMNLEFGEYGKPSLQANSTDLRFNFTDTCGYGLFAFSLSNEVGVDFECASREGKFDRIVERRFAPEEQYLRDLSMVDFLRCWTRKEAFGKAVGTGLNYPLREYVMCDDLSQHDCVLEKEGYYGQQFSLFVNKEKFIACLFSEGIEAKELSSFYLQSN